MAGRLAEIERGKGLAILLVVFGHLVARRDPADVTWYAPLRVLVYLFHMPFFFYLSGYAAWCGGLLRVTPGTWAGFVRLRARRLLVPGAALGLGVLAAKLALGAAIAPDNPPAGLWAGLSGLAWDTGHSPETSVWYLAVLFALSAGVPALVWAVGIRGAAAVAAAIYVLPLPPLAYLDRLGTYALYFMCGLLAARAGEAWLAWIDRWRARLGLAFAALLLAAWEGWLGDLGVDGFPHKWFLLGFGLLSMPVLHGAVRAAPLARSAALARLGADCFAIYLFNTVAIGAAKAALGTVTTWDGPRFLPFACALMAAGVLGPMALKRMLQNRDIWASAMPFRALSGIANFVVSSPSRVSSRPHWRVARAKRRSSRSA
jgi:peptidoglycan/LPS O-acetylase OafA/YrhL